MKTIHLLATLIAPAAAMAQLPANLAFAKADKNNDHVLDRNEAAVFAALVQPSVATAETPEAPKGDLAEFLTIDVGSSAAPGPDRGISKAEFAAALEAGRVVPRSGRSAEALLKELYPHFGDGMLDPKEYSAAKSAGKFTYKVVSDEIAGAIASANEFTKQSELLKSWKDNVHISASGLGEKDSKGPATFNWIRQRKTGAVKETTSRWEVDGKIEYRSDDFLGAGHPGQDLMLSGAIEALIVDYNSRESSEHGGSVNKLRYSAGVVYRTKGPNSNWQENLFKLNGNYITDPSAEKRGWTGSLSWEPVIMDWHVGNTSPLFKSKPNSWLFTWQPVIAVEVGSQETEFLNDETLVGDSTSTVRLADGTRRRTKTQVFDVSHRTVEEDIAQGVIAVNGLLNINANLSLTGSYQMRAELNGTNRVAHLGKVGIQLAMPELFPGLETTIAADYTVGNDGPDEERQDILKLGLGVKF